MRVLIRFSVFCLMVFLGLAPGALMGAEPFDSEISAVRALIEELSDNLEKDNLNVTIGTLTMENSKISSQFAENLLTLVLAEMSHPDHSEDYRKVKRQILTRSAVRTRGGLIRETDSDVPGSTNVGLFGSYRQSKDKSVIYVTMRMEEENGARISEAEVALKRSSIRLPIEPANLTKVEQTEKQIDKLSQPKNEFKIDLWINKGNGGVYRAGEDLRIMFRTELDCYLRVLYIDVEGNRILLYPTERDNTDKLRAGIVHELHRNNKYTIQRPFGTELVMAFASTTPFSDEGVTNFGGGYKGISVDQSTASAVKNMRGVIVSTQIVSTSVIPKKSEVRVLITTMP